MNTLSYSGHLILIREIKAGRWLCLQPGRDKTNNFIYETWTVSFTGLLVSTVG